MSTSADTIDISRLSDYLENRLIGFAGPITLRKFPGGQSNPTYLLETPTASYVLRRQPFGVLLKSAHAVDREFRVLMALQGTAVPTPRPHLMCEDISVIGSMFYVMSHERGQIYWDPALPGLTLDQRGRVYSELIRVLAALHDVDVDKIGLGHFGRRSNYFGRQLSRWIKQYRASETHRIAAVETLMDSLAKRMPSDDGHCSLIHGDYRLDNLMFEPETQQACALLDWELSTLGHPLADLAYFCALPRLPSDGLVPGLGDVDRKALGMPSEEEVVARYCELRGIASIRGWDFYIAFSFFRMAAIVQGVYKRALDGNASNPRALEMGQAVQMLSQAGLEAVGACFAA